MDLINKEVLHKTLGPGIILSKEMSSNGKDEYITVRFEKDDRVSKFTYPICFKGFLTLIDNDDNQALKIEIDEFESAKEKSEKELREKREAEFISKKYRENKSKSNKSVSAKSFNSVDEFCEEYKKVLIQEIMHLKNTEGKLQQLTDGKLVEKKSKQYIYSFESDEELNYPEGTQINIKDINRNIVGSIVSCEGFITIISSSEYLGAEIPLLKFVAESWRLINSLVEKLESIKDSPSNIVCSLICDGKKSIDRTGAITKSQESALKMSSSQPITFIWGPPGTGKTQTLAKIVTEYMQQSKKVLMVSYSNVSVDGAILRVYNQNKSVRPGKLVRYGYPRQQEILDHKYLSSYNLSINNHPELIDERTALLEERKSLTRTSKKYVDITERLKNIRKTLLSEEKASIANADFVATTISKALVDSAIFEADFDVVIFDEASMAYVPQVIFAASLAKCHFICMGDFCQLPPIVQSSADSLLNADIFQYCGITSAVKEGYSHKWLCMLDTQYRMHPKISDFAGMYMYENQLKSADTTKNSRENIVFSSPFEGFPISLADLSGAMSVCTKTLDGSRVNVLSALVSFYLALNAAKHNEVGIITPYHSEARLLHAMACDAIDKLEGYKHISAATVHQFQGSEKDVIIYDAVDCYRMPYPSTLLTSSTNDYANRLFNVALTRARGKFINVVNSSYMDNKNLSKNLIFKRMMDTQKHKDSNINCKELLPSLKPIEKFMQLLTSTNVEEIFNQDISTAKKEVRIDIPGTINKEFNLIFFASILKNLKSKGVKIIIRAESKVNIPSELRQFAIEDPFVANPVAIIDKSIIWFGEPLSSANFIAEGESIETKYRPIFRLSAPHTAKKLINLLDMNKTADRSTEVILDENGKAEINSLSDYVLANKKCPACGKPMKLQKSKTGRFFFSCTSYPACTHSEFDDIDIIEKYLYRNGGVGQRCPKCNLSLETKKGRYGLYVQCCGINKHFYKLDEI